MLYTIKELEKEVFPKVFETYETFQNFFGEEFTDLQDVPDMKPHLQHVNIQPDENDRYDVPAELIDTIRTRHHSNYFHIYVYWPRVTITNEHDKSVDIQELYAKVTITWNGLIPWEYRGFQLNRSHYPMEQFMFGYSHHGYMHSHISDIPKGHYQDFQNPCLGTGPINNTIGTLKQNYDSITWMLFCQELAMYVTVESIAGRPYNYLEEIGNKRSHPRYKGYSSCNSYELNTGKELFINFFSTDTLKSFIRYYLRHGHLNISYRNEEYTVGMPYYDYILDISNAFISFFNENLIGFDIRQMQTACIIDKVLIADGKFYQSDETDTRHNVSSDIGSRVLTFKGREITLTIDDAAEFNPMFTTLLNNKTALFILRNILKTINYRYRNDNTDTQGGTEDTASTNKNVRYL